MAQKRPRRRANIEYLRCAAKGKDTTAAGLGGKENRLLLKNDRFCRYCKGTGEDPKAHHRYTSGGHDDRRCPKCNGECVEAIDEEKDGRVADVVLAAD